LLTPFPSRLPLSKAPDMHVLTLTSLFPNSKQPTLAIFIRNRMVNSAKRFGNPWTIVAPTAYYPKFPFPTIAAYDQQARIPAFEEPDGFPVYHPRYLVTPKVGMGSYGRWMSKGARETVLAIHRKNPIDLIDGHYVYPDGTAAVDLGRELGVPVILSARGTDLNLYPQFPRIRPLIQKNLERCAHLICVCSELKDTAMELGMPEARISVIGNGVDATVFHPGDKAAARKKLNLPADRKIFLAVGQLIERKGFHLLIEALAMLERGDAILVLVGKGEYHDTLKSLAAKLGLADRVLFPGSQLNRDLPIWYQAADVFALASSREGWPNVVCEALACGLPVVATKIAGIPEIVDGPGLGILVSERSAKALAPAMKASLEKDWDNAAISAKGMARTWDSVSDQLLPLFRKVLAGSAASAKAHSNA
jgi:teichuronic acid biosynthesis glycosyltransferase TuaC